MPFPAAVPCPLGRLEKYLERMKQLEEIVLLSRVSEAWSPGRREIRVLVDPEK